MHEESLLSLINFNENGHHDHDDHDFVPDLWLIDYLVHPHYCFLNDYVHISSLLYAYVNHGYAHVRDCGCGRVYDHFYMHAFFYVIHVRVHVILHGYVNNFYVHDDYLFILIILIIFF
jgi:hypothetical protein